MLKNTLVIAAFILLMGVQSAWADCQNGQPTTIAFGNGINTTLTDAKYSALALKRAVLRSLETRIDPSCIAFTVAYDEKFLDSNNVVISTTNTLAQIADAAVQQGIDFTANFWDYWYGNFNGQPPSWLTDIQRTAITSVASVFQPDLIAQENFYNLELARGHSVIVVAHSQGNLYANLAYDFLKALGGSERLHVVAVATPAHSVAGAGPYFTLFWDVITLVPGSLAPDIFNDAPSPCLLGITYGIACHSFLGSYFDPTNGDKTRPAIIAAVTHWLTPASSARWLAFVDGDPGLPGDGIVVSPQISAPYFNPFTVTSPIGLGSAPNGLTFTVFVPTGTPPLEALFLQITNGVAPSDVCYVKLLEYAPSIGTTIQINGVSGLVSLVDPASYSDYVTVANSSPRPGCRTVSIQDLVVTNLIPQSPRGYPQEQFRTLDAAAVALGLNIFP